MDDRIAAGRVSAELYLDGRGLTAVPEELRGSADLVHLDLRDNPIAELPPWLAELPALRSLSVGGQPIARCPLDLPQLEHLCLHELELTRLPPAIARLTRLRTLDLGHNRLGEIPPLPPALEVLYLADNRLSALPDAVRG